MRTDDRPTVAFLTPVAPASRGNGLAMRAGLFLEGLSRGYEVTVVVLPVFGTAPGEGDLVKELAAGCVTLDLAGPADARTWPSVLLGTPEGRRRAHEVYPLPAVCRQPSRAGTADLRRLTQGVSLVHIMRSYLAPCVDFLFDDESRPRLTLDLDELDSGVRRQLGHSEEAERFERLERYYLPRVDHVYVASDAEARMIGRSCDASRVSTVPNAVRAPAPSQPAEKQHDLLFVGNLSYEPNIDAARWLCEEIRPLLGAVTIAIVGSRPGSAVRALADLPGVTVAGDVLEVTPWYVRSRVAVAPLRIGGGTRTKVVEALAHGLPVVATPMRAAGIADGDSHGVLTAATAKDFATGCRRLLDDGAAAAGIAAAGRMHEMTAKQVAERIDLLTRSAVDDRSAAATADAQVDRRRRDAAG